MRNLIFTIAFAWVGAAGIAAGVALALADQGPQGPAGPPGPSAAAAEVGRCDRLLSQISTAQTELAARVIFGELQDAGCKVTTSINR